MRALHLDSEGWVGPLYKMVELPNQSILQEVGTNRLVNRPKFPNILWPSLGLVESAD
jgi:hypothetical protein